MFVKALVKSFFAFLFFPYLNSSAQTFTRKIRTAEYKQMQVDLCKGWNTWYNNSILTHALLPEGFAIKAHQIAQLPKRLNREVVGISIDKDQLILGNCRYRGAFPKPD